MAPAGSCDLNPGFFLHAVIGLAVGLQCVRGKGISVMLQGQQLASPDGAVYLTAGSDGSLILYNTQRVATYGALSPAAILWSSQSGGQSGGPFTVIMQEVRDVPLPSVPHRLACLETWLTEQQTYLVPQQHVTHDGCLCELPQRAVCAPSRLIRPFNAESSRAAQSSWL